MADIAKIRVVVADPKTRDAVTTSFNNMKELLAWAGEQAKKEKPKNV